MNDRQPDDNSWKDRSGMLVFQCLSSNICHLTCLCCLPPPLPHHHCFSAIYKHIPQGYNLNHIQNFVMDRAWKIIIIHLLLSRVLYIIHQVFLFRKHNISASPGQTFQEYQHFKVLQSLAVCIWSIFLHLWVNLFSILLYNEYILKVKLFTCHSKFNYKYYKWAPFLYKQFPQLLHGMIVVGVYFLLQVYPGVNMCTEKGWYKFIVSNRQILETILSSYELFLIWLLASF
jgi:hypothetical protein